MSYKCVIFDLDGTLINTIEDLKNACNYALDQFHLPLISTSDTMRFIGHGIRNLVLKASNNDSRIDSLLTYFKEYYSKNYNVESYAYEGITEVLDWCLEHGIDIGVYTNKVEEIAQKLCLEHFQNRFSFIYGEVNGREKKPNPIFILQKIKECHLQKSEVLYIGDSEVDVKLSQNAGIPGLFVSYGFRDEAILRQCTDRVVSAPKDILSYLSRTE